MGIRKASCPPYQTAITKYHSFMPHDLSNLRGIVPPLVTPLARPDALDVAGLERLLARVLSAPVAGVFVLGTTGEGPNLSHRLRRDVIEQTAKIVAGRVPERLDATD